MKPDPECLHVCQACFLPSLPRGPSPGIPTNVYHVFLPRMFAVMRFQFSRRFPLEFPVFHARFEGRPLNVASHEREEQNVETR